MADYQKNELLKSLLPTTGISGEAAGRQAEIPAALDDLARTIYRVSELSETLHARLAKVVRSEPETGCAPSKPESRPEVQMASDIRSLDGRLRGAEDILSNINQRLEI